MVAVHHRDRLAVRSVRVVGAPFVTSEPKGITSYLQRHKLQPGELLIEVHHRGRGKKIAFKIFHRGKFVKQCDSRTETLQWMRGDEPQASLFDTGV